MHKTTTIETLVKSLYTETDDAKRLLTEQQLTQICNQNITELTQHLLALLRKKEFVVIVSVLLKKLFPSFSHLQQIAKENLLRDLLQILSSNGENQNSCDLFVETVAEFYVKVVGAHNSPQILENLF